MIPKARGLASRRVVRTRSGCFSLLLSGVLCTGGSAVAEEVLEMGLEDLLGVQVTSVSKRPQSLSDAAAAVFVITRADLHRSGATSIPDALRMVPGLHVARIDGSKWAVTSRGFNGRFANKLLVLVDGRTVYSPSFSGVYWEVQDVLLEDVERIEVIRGPGATVWGANAVNGVINILTRHAADTQGGLLTAGAGDEESAFASLRYGTRLGEGNYGRVYAKGLRRDGFVHPGGEPAGDAWSSLRGGFRLDSKLEGGEAASVEGVWYRGEVDQRVVWPVNEPPYARRVDDTADVGGGHLIARWERNQSAVSGWSLQLYYDRFERDERILDETRDTFDLEWTRRHEPVAGHKLVWGAGYRYTRDHFDGSEVIKVAPARRGDRLFSAFLEDEIEIVEHSVWLTLGSKLEHNDYSGAELQPSVRVAWAPDARSRVWATVSRAVRTPSRGDFSFTIGNAILPPGSKYNPFALPLMPVVAGNPEMRSEELLAYELGYRLVPSRGLSLDIAAYLNRYTNLRTFRTTGLAVGDDYLRLLNQFDNGVTGTTYGVELALDWQLSNSTRLDLAYSYAGTDVEWLTSFDLAQNSAAPRHELSLRAAVNLRADLDFDVWLRYTDAINVVNSSVSVDPFGVDAYWTLDVRLAWRPSADLELSLVGQNLLDAHHLEYAQEAFTPVTEIERGVYGKLEWRF